ncbi:MAG TPA: HAD family phosphatase [Bacillota bacterium]|nr:HAD family phosphatase [Bacillota bacterium]
MTIKAVIFDIGNVALYFDHHKATKKMAKILDLPEKKVFEVINGDKNKFTNSYELGASNKVYWGEAADLLGVKKIPEKRFDQLWCSIFKPNKTAISLIKKLRKNYKTAFLSNTGRLHKVYFQKYGLYELVDVKIYSFKVGVRKPHPKIYKEALKRLKVRPNEAIFIDDLKENAEAAKKLGIHGIHFKNNNQLRKDLKKLGVKIW